MAQNNYIEELIKRNGRRLNYTIKKQKKLARAPSTKTRLVRRLHGHKAILYAKKCRIENIAAKKLVKTSTKITNTVKGSALPHFLLDRNEPNRKETEKNVEIRKKTKVGKYAVPIPRVKGVSEIEAFKSITTGKKKGLHWKRMVTKPCFVGDNFTRKDPKYERFIRPMGMRFKKAHVVNPDKQETYYLPIISFKKNPHSSLYTSLGILSKGAIIEVDVSSMGILTKDGKLVWGKYAQITNNPENDGCVNAVLLI